MSLALIAALPFLGALLPGLLIRSGRTVCATATASVTALALLGLLLHAPAVMRGEVIQTQISWLPALGLNVHFFLDGLGLLFGTLILGIGLLIILYARFYLHARDPMGQFYTYLMLFQGAMVGIVLSDNILLLLIFWELTSLSSFLLIGYWKHLPEGRQGARMALTVTGAGGLAMIAGMLILGNIAGSYDLSTILENRELIQSSPYYLPALLLILLGCFTKSAQFPFHFWLPHAMAAPTPVSAYLHSATMVKAGIFLMARMWPVLSGTAEWFWIVSSAGLITMVLGAVIGVFKDDLKALLAFSTVSHLGLVTMLLGFSTQAAAIVAVFHILNHATFKAALFMSAGIIDHEAHTRDIKRLGGLRTLMPITFVIVTIAALSMAGTPPLNGFLSKEMMLTEVVETSSVMTIFATIGAIFSVGYSFRLIAHVFLGPVRKDYPHKPHDPGLGMWIAPALLAVLGVLIGVMPLTFASDIVQTAASAVTGEALSVHISHWHGFNLPLLLSVLAFVGGALIIWQYKALSAFWQALPRPDAKRIFDGLLEPIACGARLITDWLHGGILRRYLATATVAVLLVGVYAWSTGAGSAGTRALTPVTPLALVGWLMLAGASLALFIHHRNRFLSLVLVGIVGLVVSLGFIYMSAPDLALTQISVEVAMIVLMLLALNFLPKHNPVESPLPRRARDGVIAVLAGLGMAGFVYALMTRDFSFPTIAEYHLIHSYIGGGGNNVVNVILVDFRGYDTFGELTVLGIAGLVIFAVAEGILRGGAANDRLMSWRPDMRQAGDRHPLMLAVLTRVLLPVVLLVATFIFLRGHNLPGGGFVAGLLASVALIMQYMASGYGWAARRTKVDYQALIGWGVLTAALCGAGAWLLGYPFLTSAFGYVYPPFMDKIELATAAIFDLGVFLSVFGAVVLALSSISRLSVRAGQTVNTAPYDIPIQNKSTSVKEGH